MNKTAGEYSTMEHYGNYPKCSKFLKEEDEGEEGEEGPFWMANKGVVDCHRSYAAYTRVREPLILSFVCLCEVIGLSEQFFFNYQKNSAANEPPVDLS